MLLKILTHSIAVSVTFCFDGCFVKWFKHVSSVIIRFRRPISNLQNCYSTIRRNCKNKMLCGLTDIVIFVGGAFSLDMSIICKTSPSQDAYTHQIWNSYLKEYKRNALNTKFLKLGQRSRSQ